MASTFMFSVGACGCAPGQLCQTGVCARIRKYPGDPDYNPGHAPATRPCGVCTDTRDLTNIVANFGFLDSTGSPVPTYDMAGHALTSALTPLVPLSWDGSRSAYFTPCIFLTTDYQNGGPLQAPPTGVDLGPMGLVLSLLPVGAPDGATMGQTDTCPSAGYDYGNPNQDDTLYHAQTGIQPYTCDGNGLHAHWITGDGATSGFLYDLRYYLGITDVYMNIIPFPACDFCGIQCTLCDNAHFATAAIQDALGVHFLNKYNTAPAGLVAYGGMWSAPIFYNATCWNGTTTTTGQNIYWWNFKCDGDNIVITLIWPTHLIISDGVNPPLNNQLVGLCANPTAPGFGLPPSPNYSSNMYTFQPTTCNPATASDTMSWPNTPGLGGTVTVSPPPGNFNVVAKQEIPNTTFCCSPCGIPLKDLVVSWVNVLSGSGSTPLVYSYPAHWNSACSNQLLYALSCLAGVTQFSVTYFLTGDCPRGQQQSCTSPGRNPFSLVLTDYSCEPFSLTYKCTVQSCVVLGDDGYTLFTVSETA